MRFDIPEYKYQAEKNVRYEMVDMPLNEEETGYFFTYGVAVIQEGIEIFRIEDITVNKEAMENLILKCNDMELSCLHIWDVVEDFLLE